MIKFFRHIRKTMIEDSKITRYFLYAIGEIFLVVIGILIALYVNDWNQNRQLRLEEQQSLASLKSELEGNLEKFDYKYNNQKLRKEAINRILFHDLSGADLPELDSLYKMSFYSWTFAPSFSVYNSLVSTGKINQFSNENLKIRLSEFKDRVLDFQDEEVNLWQFSQEHLFEHELYNSGLLSETKFNLRPRTSEERTLDKQIYLEEFQIPEFRNQLTLTLLHLGLVFSEGDALRKELVELIELIEENLEKAKF